MIYDCTIENALIEIDDSDVKAMLTRTFKTFGYNPAVDTVDSIDISDLPRIVEGILLGVVEILREDEGVLYVVMADYLYYIFYQSKLFPSVKGVSSINIQLRTYFIRYVLTKQVPELIMLFLEQGIFPQFYSAMLIHEIRNTQFYNFFNVVNLDEIIHSVTFGSNDVNTTSICVTVMDEIIEDVLFKKTEDCYEEITEIINNTDLFKRIPLWMYDDLDSIYRTAEITAIFTSVFGKEESEMPIQFDENLILKLSDKIYRQNMSVLLNDIVTSISAHTSDHSESLLDRFVVTNSAFQKTYDAVFRDYVSLFLNNNIITYINGTTEDDVTKELNKILLLLTSYTMCYIITEFLWTLKNENIGPVIYSLLLSSIVKEVLCYRVYEVNPK